MSDERHEWFGSDGSKFVARFDYDDGAAVVRMESPTVSVRWRDDRVMACEILNLARQLASLRERHERLRKMFHGLRYFLETRVGVCLDELDAELAPLYSELRSQGLPPENSPQQAEALEAVEPKQSDRPPQGGHLDRSLSNTNRIVKSPVKGKGR